MPEQLRILLLGSPSIRWGDKPVKIQRRLLRGLLFYLAVQRSGASRSDLVFRFWPDTNEGVARANLRSAISRLRTELGDSSLILTDGDSILLNRQRIYVDLDEFNVLVSTAFGLATQVPGTEPLSEEISCKLWQGLTLWRGKQFLDGFHQPKNIEFERWLDETRLMLLQRVEAIKERLANHEAASGDIGAAIRWAMSIISANPLHAGMHRKLLYYMIESGQRSEAENYCSTIEELYATHEEEIPKSLAEAIDSIRGDEWHSDRYSLLDWPAALDAGLPFVGRRKLLQDLQHVFQRGGAVVIEGEAGAGKSRLAYEFYKSLERRPRLFIAQCREDETSLPFQPLIDVLRHAVLQEEWQQLDPVWTAQLLQLLPELAISLPALKPSASNGMTASRTNLFEAVRQILILAGHNKRVFFFLDDAQWCDEATLAAINYLQERQFFSEHGLLLMAARWEEQNPALNQFLGRSRRAAPILRYDLEQLTEAEIARLAGFALKQEVTPELAQRLDAETGGNPLLILETLRTLVSSGADIKEALAKERLPLSRSISALVHDRKRHLSPTAHQVLETAAVIGTEFSLALVEVSTTADPEEVAAALDELEMANFIHPSHLAESPGTYVFTHEKFREVLLLDLSPARRRLLNLRVARNLESHSYEPGDKRDAVLAGRYEMAGDYGKAFEYWLQAAGHARRLFSVEEAVHAYRRAERMLHLVESHMTADKIYNLYSRWARLGFEIGSRETIEEASTAMLLQGERLNDFLLIGSALTGLATTDFLSYQPMRALERVQKALKYLEPLGNLKETVRALNRMGFCLMRLDRNYEAIAVFEKVLALAKTAEDSLVQFEAVDASSRLAIVYIYTCQPKKAVQLLEPLVARMEQFRGTVYPVYLNYSMAFSQYYLTNYRLSIEYARQGIALAEQAQNNRLLCFLLTTEARSLLALGSLDEVWSRSERALAIALEGHYSDLISEAYCVQGNFHRAIGNYDQAIEAYQLGSANSATTYDRLNNQYRRASTLISQGNAEDGLRFLEACAAEARQAELGLVLGPVLLNLAQAYLELGNFTRAAACREELQRQAEGSMGHLILGMQHLRVKECLQQGRQEEAAREADCLMEMGVRSGNVWLELEAHQIRGEIDKNLGREPYPGLARVEELLNTIASQAVSEPAASSFGCFRQKTQATLMD